ncbi:sugar ABC transporter ATP-binding protein [Extibacter muris]|uniref:sugar ABC transporter ATP-binding protein n=1 Tax=Extibacter muris TaxID=1796622 RepID=UPI001D08EB5E|nr:sugar ABC transporter ATP-binding protein [Extibacter muris]MCB6201544.1 sugar ABC transporter ATP-binding protein [Extibacter muris]MCQ4662870.1 sugar ABC transporter ATP-binding protein [Extibacter muris]MCQ4692715.1 sugar ABC transporter ATP-binding protein [Extibacter muris]
MRYLEEKAREGEAYVLECRGISKAFGGTQALKDVNLFVRPGEVHALLGENGAGKSTLMKCIIGLHQQDEGTIRFEGRPYTARGPVEALNAGISMIHQELNPEPHLTIAESVFLKREDTRGIFLNKKAQNERAEDILKKFNFPHGAKTLMKELTLAQMQMVEIIKAVSCNARLIIMDEPTSSLDSEETEHLFNTIRELKEKGVAIIYISHRMEEIFRISDHVSVFRDGTYIGERTMEGVTRDELISMMVGRKVENVFPKTACDIGDVVFKVDKLSGKGFEDISFEVRKGEILGISGLVGSGRSETMRAIFGMDPVTGGRIFLEGREIKIRKPSQAIRHGICMVNEDRKNYGLALHRSIRENMTLPTLPMKQKAPILNKRQEEKECLEMGKMLTLKSASIEHDAFSLSGGNQQKVVLAKWLLADPKVLILDEPTRGVDVGAKSEIHTLMCEFAARGMAVIMISSELPEVMGMSDRILVYHEGKINGEVSREEILNGSADQETILGKAFGGK